MAGRHVGPRSEEDAAEEAVDKAAAALNEAVAAAVEAVAAAVEAADESGLPVAPEADQF